LIPVANPPLLAALSPACLFGGSAPRMLTAIDSSSFIDARLAVKLITRIAKLKAVLRQTMDDKVG